MTLVLIAMIIVALIIFIFLRPFVIKGLLMSYKSGRLGPAINEMAAFENRTIHTSKPEPWLEVSSIQSCLSDEAWKKL